MAINDVDLAEVLVRSARHCCICRNFLPLYIQVHHIVEKAEGGCDDIDNLIPICISCHAAVHTQTKMTKGFSSKELKMHRDTVYEMVAMGKLPASKPLSHEEVAAITSSIVGAMGRTSNATEGLPQNVAEVLLACAAEGLPIYIGNVVHWHSDGSRTIVDDQVVLNIGNQTIMAALESTSKYPASILRLIKDDFLELKDELFWITPNGLAYVEKMVRTLSTFTTKKAVCRSCGLHFILCTDHGDRHHSGNLTCPECGQHRGMFSVWTQKELGFIFQFVPGRATRSE